MNIDNAKRIATTVSAAAICISGTWIAAPAQAQPHVPECSDAAVGHLDIADIAEIVAMRKVQMAHDYVAFAARAEHVARGR